jgi:hypothetical protein
MARTSASSSTAKDRLRKTVLATGGYFRENGNGTVTMKLGRPMSVQALAGLHVHGLEPQPTPATARPQPRARRRRPTRTTTARRSRSPGRPRPPRPLELDAAAA